MLLGQYFIFLKLVRVLALSEYIGHSTLASFFRGVISGMNARTYFSEHPLPGAKAR